VNGGRARSSPELTARRGLEQGVLATGTKLLTNLGKMDSILLLAWKSLKKSARTVADAVGAAASKTPGQTTEILEN
jgi:hypothetical protein